MQKKVKHYLLKIIYWDYALLMAVLFFIFIIPLFPAKLHMNLYTGFILSIYLLAAIAVGKNNKYLLILATIVFVLRFLSATLDWYMINGISKILSILLFFIIVTSFIKNIATAKQVTVGVILDAINGYLLLGITFSIIMSILMQFDNQSFHFPGNVDNSNSDTFEFGNNLYFSLVTITTLGYGDVLPLTPAAKSLATFISVTGQLYIAILVAMLVGKFSSAKAKSD